MKKISTFGVAVTATFILLQSAEAGSRGGGRSFGGGSHFSGGARYSAPSRSYSGASRSFSSSSRSYSGPSPSYSGPSRSYSNGARYNTAGRVSAAPVVRGRHYGANGPRVSSRTTWRNPTYTNRNRFSGNRTTAFNAANNVRGDGRWANGNRNRSYGNLANGDRIRANGDRAWSNGDRTRGNGNRNWANGNRRGFDPSRERVVARHGANWQRNWDRNRDHSWNGKRCHFRNGYWWVYAPLFLYPSYGYGYGYGYDYYPYDGYYDGAYYEDSYSAEPAAYTNQQEYAADSSVSDVQSALAREGYYDGAIDGQLGPGTRQALRRYQADHGLPVTGAITRGVIQALRLR